MSTTREEILAALADRPAGLTSKELAPLCPACECDEMVVGRTIAALRADNKIHSGTEFRAGGGTVWIAGPTPGPAAEVRVPLESPRSATASTAAKAIAALRQASPGARPSSAPARPAPEESATMSKKTVAERCVDALKQHGRLTVPQLAKHAKSTAGSLYTIGTQLKKLGVVKVARGIYAMAGSAAAKASPASQPVKKEKVKAARTVRRDPPEPREHKPNGAARFAIDQGGELAIEVDGSGAIRLQAEAFAKLRDFIERTKSIWEDA